MTCKDCLHYELCKYNTYQEAHYFGKDKKIYITIDNNSPCKYFTDRSEWVHLPCKVGDKLYILYSVTKEIEECDITGFIIQTKHDVIKFKDGTIYTIWDKDYNAHFGKTLFLTREEAEKALEEKK